MGSRVDHGRRTGWRAALDPELWCQAFAAGTAGAVSMAILGCALSLVRDTTGHDWYAAAKVTVADLLIAAGFDEDAPVEYRNADGVVETVTRSSLTYGFRARWARQDILGAAWDGATLGAIAGFGGALLCLVLIRRSMEARRTRYPAYDPEPAPLPQARERFAPPPPAAAAPVPAAPESERTQPIGPDSGGASNDKSVPRSDEAAAPDRREGEERDNERWV